MGRAYPQTFSSDAGRDPGDWQSLRQDLVALLDQVDSQVGRGRQDAGAERLRDTRSNDELPQARHRDALRQVQRQISRFEEPAPHLPPNPRDSLEAAISQIRGRPAAPRPVPVPIQTPGRDDGPALDKLMQSVSSISQRLERLEGDIRTQVRSGSDVHDVAEQVSQLAHVVELLAGAVGETGQVKRLEAQIAGLGDMLANTVGDNAQSKRIEGQIASLGRIISQGREIDSSALTRRIDDIASTIGRLAELQVHYVDKVENPVAGQAFRDGMRSIEDSVRAIYDRIDGLERNATVKPEDLEQISAQMARFTEAMGAGGTAPHSLVELIDELNTRIADIESGDRLLPQLRKDLAVLRDGVVFSLAPRFDAIETRMETLSTRDDVAELGRQVGLLSERVNQRQPDGGGIGQLEAQVRQLVARMDQTGEQLAGLARMTSDGAGLVMPDLSAMADMVAERTAAAIGKSDSSALSETISGLERRISAMLETMPRDPIAGDLGEVQAGVGEVNQRLKRLEETLLNRAASAEPIAPATRTDIASIIAASEPMPRARDAMPRSPDAEMPLIDPPFPEPTGPVAAALDARTASRKRHPGLDEDISFAARHEPPQRPEPPPGFAPEAIDIPPAPMPSADFTGAATESDMSPVTPASTNTFIAAARRAAQRQTNARSAPTKDSPMGRALSRFSLSRNGGDADATPAPTMKPLRAKPEPAPMQAPSIELPAADGAPKAAGKPSFLARNSKTIIFAAAVVALAFLTLNLVAQRLNQPAETSDAAPVAAPVTDAIPAPASTGDIAVPIESPAADSFAASMPPRVIPDSGTTTGSIGGISPAFTNSPIASMPSTFAAPSELGQAPAATGTETPATVGDASASASDASSDVAAVDPSAIVPLAAPAAAPAAGSFDMPPEKIGPAELRQAAANGDPRAEFEVAAVFTEGRIVPKDYAQAATWYSRAADQGFVPAEYRLGSLYESGDGVTKNLDTAMSWYEKAAEAGNRMSMHNLASIYAGGQLGKQQFDLAAKWFLKAAELGLTDSQFNLGMLYARGLGVPQSLSDSYKWFSLAAQSGDKDAGKARDDIARSLDAATVAKVTDEVKAFKPDPVDLAANFAPIGTWTKSFNPGETIASRDIVASVQKALNKLGYDVGAPDGVAGKKTADAIKAFEAGTGMSQTGLINPRLLAVLGSQPV